MCEVVTQYDIYIIEMSVVPKQHSTGVGTIRVVCSLEVCSPTLWDMLETIYIIRFWISLNVISMQVVTLGLKVNIYRAIVGDYGHWFYIFYIRNWLPCIRLPMMWMNHVCCW